MRSLLYTLLSCLVIAAGLPAFAQQGTWPKVITTAKAAEIKVFAFQPQSLNGNNLNLQAAISVKESSSSEPVFGMMWGEAIVEKDQYNQVSGVSKFTVSNLKVPGVSEEEDVNELRDILQEEIPKFNLSIPVTGLLSEIAANQNQQKLAGKINTNPPTIIFTKTPSILVFIDGEPQLQKNTSWGVEQVVNTPFTIIRTNDQHFYLYGNKKWFRATSLTGTWSYLSDIPQSLGAIDKEVRKADTSALTDQTTPNVIVSTEPAELIQSKGEPNFALIQGTNLLYMTNTSNDIFLDINSQQYYVLISGRWYKASNLNSKWVYTSSGSLPADFAKIPEGSAKDVVLANIEGTPAAEESVLDAQVPQMAKVDRNTATASVDYDGEPEFEQIEGTDMKYAVNTPGAVINAGRKYYYVENGVWFESNHPNGPWKVATERPDEVANIPPSSPVYNIKYVYIYDATPEYVYMGYTPGYLGTYIYGNTIVYGTGFRYRPWRGRHYYARPVTWGFNMRYNPWSGWNFGISFGSGWFYSEFDNYNYFGHPVGYDDCSNGWWGQSAYRPQYSRRYGNYYGRNVIINNNYIVSNNRANNVYRSRRDVVTYDRSGYDLRYNRNSGYSQNNGRYNNNGNADRRYERGQDMSNNGNAGTQRPGRFGGTQQSNNDGNVNNNDSRRPVDRLEGQRPGRLYNPQGNAAGNSGNVADNRTNTNNNGVSRPGNVNGGLGNRRSESGNTDAGNTPGNPGNRFGRNNTPANTQTPANENSNQAETRRLRNIISTPGNADAGQGNVRVPQTNTETPQADNRPQQSQRVFKPQRSDLDRNAGSEQPQRSYTPQRRVETPEANTSTGQPQRIFTPQRRDLERNAGQEQPQRTYNPQRSEAPAAERRPEIQRTAPPSSNGSGNEDNGNRRLQNQDGGNGGRIQRPARIGN